MAQCAPVKPTPRRGRPRLDEDEESVSVSVRMTSSAYDSLYERAQRERTTIAELVRRELQPPRPPKR